MDPLSDVLSLLKPLSYSAGGLDAGGDWSVRIPRHEGIKCYAVVSGQCWLSVQGTPGDLLLQSGDCFLLQRPFCLSSDLTLTPVDFQSIFATPLKGGIFSVNGGGDCFIVGGHFSLSGNHANLLLGVLPPVVQLHKESDKAELRWSLERLRQELRDPRPGGDLVAQHLAHMMLIQALRLYLAEGLSGGVGWLFALADKHMNAALRSMHEDPAHSWTVQTLAERAGMSRSNFASRFKETVGESPLKYLTRWRMMLAGERLQNSDSPMSEIAASLGYESESAYGKAFKRVMGCSPRQFRCGQLLVPLSATENSRIDQMEGTAS
ncbi:AraC family transcriptional regulator [Caballeronia sordidicola]|uniref:AraC family transcriptional regulator n=1 Tax=Caballeronia sordidicola TaxID=196367 RepID=UPI000B77F529|nr:AraC family transcriptional regulator [Caballeronia sordidicola]